MGTTITQFDEAVTHLIDGSASSEDECTDKLSEAKRRLYEMHEKVKFMADHVSVAENRTEKIIKEITEYVDKLNGTKEVCEENIKKCGKKKETEREILKVLKKDLEEMKYTMEVHNVETSSSEGDWVEGGTLDIPTGEGWTYIPHDA